MHSINELNKTIRRSAKRGSESFLHAYLEHEATALDLLKKFNGVKSEIYLKEVDAELKNYIRFSAMFSDITTINTTPSGKNDTQMSIIHPESKYFRERQITIPAKYVPETGNDPKRFTPCYYHRNDQEIRNLFQDYRPMLEHERLVIRPLRGLYVGFPEKETGNLYYVDPNTSDDHWYINEKQDQEFVTIDNGLSLKTQRQLFDVTLPFFSDIDFKVLCKILDDEADILSAFRIELKNVINQSGSDLKSTSEIVQDILRPRIDKINKKFQKIQGRHRLGVGVAVGSFILSFSIVSLQGKNLFEALGASGIVGTIGTLLNSNADYFDKGSDLKEDPLYLLWQIKRRS